VDNGWISIDTHGCFVSDALCRLAVGRDYDNSCPVREVRAGGGDEDVKVVLTVIRAEQAGDGMPSTRAEEVTA